MLHTQGKAMTDFVAHAESSDLNKINGLLENGLVIVNTMLVMEAEISKELCQAGAAISKAVCSAEAAIEKYDTKDLSEYLEANFKGFGERSSEEQIREELANPHSAIYVIRKRNRIVSSVTMWQIDDETVAVENIFTIPSYRGRHYASYILNRVLDEALQKGYRRAKLTVYGDDTEAILMYYKLGFTVTKVLQEFR